MSTVPVKINSESTAWSYIEQALEGKYDSDVIQLEFDSWPIFKFNVKGDRYNSTLTTNLMKSLVELQGHLNRVYAEIIYGKNAKSLTAEERAALEIVFKVESGSSALTADLSSFFAELGKSAMEKMTGRQLVGLVIGVAVIWSGSSTYKFILKEDSAKQQELNRSKMELKLLEQQPKLMKLQNEQMATVLNILKSVSDATEVVLDETKIGQTELEAISKPERQPTELQRIDDLYHITSLKIKPDSYKIEVLRASDGLTILTSLDKGHLNFDEMDRVMKAFTSEAPIHLNIVCRVRGEVITSANIVGLSDLASGESVADLEDKKSDVGDS